MARLSYPPARLRTSSIYKIEGSNRLTVTKRIEGPTSLLTTTVQGKLEDQLDDRMITIHPNTTDSQTRCIIERTASAVSGNSELVDQKTIKAWQRFHKSLVPVEVVIPYADVIAQFVSRWKNLPTSARRAFKRFLSAIMTIALVHQKQRRKDEQGRLIAEYSDYFIAHQLLEKSFSESLGNVERHTDERIRMIEAVKRMTPKALSEKTGVSTSAISQWSVPLIERGVLGWCDENGVEFKDQNALEKAKRSGKAHLYVAGGKSLPTVFQLTGDPRWDKGGELYAAYDLELDAPEIAGSVELNHAKGDGLMRFDAGDSIDAQEPKKSPVKLLSVKSHSDVLKMVSDQKEQGSDAGQGDGFIKSLEDHFGEILLSDSYKVANS